MADAGEVRVRVSADTTSLEKGMVSSKQKIDSLGRSMDKTAPASSKLGAALKNPAVQALALGTAVAYMVSKQLTAIDAMSKLSAKLGITTEAVAGLQHIANLTGVSFDQMSNAMQKMDVNIGNAQRGIGNAGSALDKLGLSAEKVQSMTSDQAFFAVADALGGVEDRTVAATIATDLFGRSGVQMLGVMRANKGNFQEMADEAKALGLAVSNEAAAKIEQFNDTMTRVKAIGTGFFRQLTVGLTPALQEFGDVLFSASLDGGVLKSVMEGLTTVISGLVKGISAAVRGFDALSKYSSMQGQITTQKNILKVTQEYTDAAVRQFGSINAIGEAYRAGDPAAVKYYATLTALGKMSEESAKKTLAFADSLDKMKASSEGLSSAAPVSRAQSPRPGGGGGGGVPKEDPLIAVRNSLKSETQILEEERQKQHEIILKSNARKFESEAERQALFEETERQHQEKLNDIRQKNMSDAEKFSAMSWHRQTTQVVGELATLAQSVQGKGKAIFAIQKTGALAEATVNTYTGVTRSLRSYPMPLAGVMAAAHLAVGLNNVRAIASTSYGGGGPKGGGGGGAAPATSQATESAPSRDITLVMRGDEGAMYSGGQVKTMMEAMGKELADGGSFGSFRVVSA